MMSKLDRDFRSAVTKVSDKGAKMALAALYDASVNGHLLEPKMIVQLLQNIDSVARK